MKKIILLLILLTSCNLNTTSKFWNNKLNKKEVLNFDKEYNFIEFGKVLKRYNDRTGYPNIN